MRRFKLVVRRMLLPGVLVTVLFGGLVVLAARAGYGFVFNTALLVTALLALFAGLMWWAAHALDRLEVERQRGVEALQESEGRLRIAHQAAHIGAFEWNVQSGLNVWTPELEAMYGLKPGKFGRTQPAWEELVHPDDRTKAVEVVQRAFETFQPEEGEWRVVWADRSVHWIVGRFQVFKDRDGKPLRLTGVNIDITDRKRNEEALRLSEERLRLFIEHAPAPIAMLDKEMRYIATSQRWLSDFGFSGRNVLGVSHYELFPEIPERWRQILQRCLAGAVERADEDLFVRADGRRQWIRWEVRPWHTAPGCIGGIIIFSEEITARKEAEQDLRRLKDELEVRVEQRTAELAAVNRELTDFATIVSHDLKAPLRGVATLAKWLQSDYTDKLDHEGREHLTEMVKRVGRMDRMIEGILEYSRLGQVQEKKQPVALAELVPVVLEDLHLPANVKIGIAPGLPGVEGDPVRLRQVFQNLLDNAVRHATKPEVEVNVGHTDAGEFWEFRVADNGPGIEPQYFERIFKMFQTLSPKDKGGSTGVGLALVKRIVERAGGRVWVESQAGQGATFHFTWPKAKPHQEAMPAARSELIDGAGI